jgi:CRISPR-associated endonuclease/helicase Cas3
MQILVVDESEKKALRKSRRILAATLYRRGSRTFTGRLSEEGLQDLVRELKRAASKNTAIAVYRLTTHAEFELIARVGRTFLWGEEGWFAHRQTTKPSSAPESSFTAVEKLLRSLLRLAALFHDIGKANDQFQQMLRGNAGAQHLRHELISFLMLNLATKGCTPIFQTLAENPLSLFNVVSAELRAYPVPDAGVSASFLEETAQTLLLDTLQEGEQGYLSAIKYLVLTHHRQIEASSQGCLELLEGVPSLRRHSNVLKEQETFNRANLTLSHSLPWQDASWLKAVQANAKAVLATLANNPGIEELIRQSPLAWVKNIALLGRPTLIQADHLASAMKQSSAPTNEDTAYANTVLSGNSRPTLADTLPTHLLKTRYAVDAYFKGMCDKHKGLPAWEAPSDSILLSNEGPARFNWQCDAAAKVRAVPDVTNRPFFAMVVSSTGAGKTLGGPKILAAASGNHLRYTCALGLRSLTLQTGAVYRTQIGLQASDTLTVVGDALYAKLAEDLKISNEQLGSESLDDDNEVIFDEERSAKSVIVTALEFSKEQEESLAEDKSLVMTEIPVLTCTVDHLMGASTLNKGTDTRMSLRLATADLLLDEIDNYSLEDLQALGRLIHQAGCHGRRVLVMSATVSQTVLHSLYTAWLSGLEVWALRTQKKIAPVLALVSNQVPSRVFENITLNAETEIATFMTEVGSFLTHQADPKTQAVPVETGASVTDAFDRIYQQALDFAGAHHTLDAKTGQRLSTGFVRFNTVGHCRQFAYYLLEKAKVPADISLKVQCYHRRMPLMHLTYIEKSLNTLLSRKDEQLIFKNPLLLSWATSAPLRLLIVCTTSIQETGRDHDYDFAIAEPWSTRSLVQLAGRVRRHREGGITVPNIGVLSTELKVLQGKNSTLELGRERLWTGAKHSFAVLTDSQDKGYTKFWAALRNKAPLAFATPSPQAPRTAWFASEFFTPRGINAKPCLAETLSPDAPLAYLEHMSQKRRMSREPHLKGYFTLQDYWAQSNCGVECAWNRHNTVIQFRRQSSQMAQLTLDPSSGFRSLTVVTRHPQTRKVELQPRANSNDWKGGTCIKNLDRCFVRTDLLSEKDVYDMLGTSNVRALSAKLCHSFEVHVPAKENNQKNEYTIDVFFDPLLGADTKSFILE